MACRLGDIGAGRVDARSGEVAAVDDALAAGPHAAHVAHGGEPAHDEFAGGCSRGGTNLLPGRGLPAVEASWHDLVRQMDVAVDEAGHQRPSAAVDESGLGSSLKRFV